MVPAVETFDISEKMRGQTAGKAIWNTHFKAWTPVPKSIGATLIQDIRKRKGLSPEPPNQAIIGARIPEIEAETDIFPNEVIAKIMAITT